MKYIIIILVIATFTFSSCSVKNMSDREEGILIQNYQTFAIQVSDFETAGDLMDFLSDKYCTQKSKNWPFIFFDMKSKSMTNTSNRNTIKIGIEPPPCVQGRYDDRMVLEIVKDGYNTEIERFITEIDSIPSYVEKQMLSFGTNPNYAVGALNNGIWLMTKRNDKLTNLNPYIYKIIQGYISSVRKYSIMAYNKKIDELSDEEYKEIAHEFNFRLSFKYSDKPIELDLVN